MARLLINYITAHTTSKKACGGGSQERTQSGQQRCGNCGRTGHNARTCQEDTEEDSESDASVLYIASVDNNA